MDKEGLFADALLATEEVAELEQGETERNVAKIETRADPKQPRRKKAFIKLKTAPSFDPLTLQELFPEMTRKDTLKDDFSMALIKEGLGRTNEGKKDSAKESKKEAQGRES